MSVDLRAESFLDSPVALGAELGREGALQFNVRASGLFAASDIADEQLARITGMDMAWFRDSAHVGNALLERGAGDDIEKVRGVGRAFLQILHNNESLLAQAIADPDAPRLPVRVNADTLENDTEARLQNDSTGYSVWLPGKLMQRGVLKPTADDLGIMSEVVRYLEAGEYWQQPDDGQWEEDRQIHASSIGVVVASLRIVAEVFDANDYRPNTDFNALIGKGQDALKAILPYGETPPTSMYAGRKYDASHLFLVQTLDTFQARPGLAYSEVRRIEKHLVRDIGTIRYPGDSYYAPGFAEMLKPGERTTQAEGRLEKRNTLGPDAERSRTEAQWTLFDSLLSAYWGNRYERFRDPIDRQQQLHYLDRMLQQYIRIDERNVRIPEMFQKETLGADWAPNEHIPLIWSQANTLLALKQFERTA